MRVALLPKPCFPKRLFSMALVLAVALTLPGCLGGSVVQRTYYTLGYPLDRVGDRQGQTHDASILVRRFTADVAYDKNEIVFRESPYAFGYYTYKLWASKPRKMLQQLVVSHLKRSEIVVDIAERLEDTPPDYELETEVVAIEEVNSSEEQWLARVAMRFTLTKYGDRRALWTYEFDEQRPVAERSPLFVVKTMSEILEGQLTAAINELDGRLTELEVSGLAPKGGSHKKKPSAVKSVPPTPKPASDAAVEPGARLIK